MKFSKWPNGFKLFSTCKLPEIDMEKYYLLDKAGTSLELSLQDWHSSEESQSSPAPYLIRRSEDELIDD